MKENEFQAKEILAFGGGFGLCYQELLTYQAWKDFVCQE